MEPYYKELLSMARQRWQHHIPETFSLGDSKHLSDLPLGDNRTPLNNKGTPCPAVVIGQGV